MWIFDVQWFGARSPCCSRVSCTALLPAENPWGERFSVFPGEHFSWLPWSLGISFWCPGPYQISSRGPGEPSLTSCLPGSVCCSFPPAASPAPLLSVPTEQTRHPVGTKAHSFICYHWSHLTWQESAQSVTLPVDWVGKHLAPRSLINCKTALSSFSWQFSWELPLYSWTDFWKTVKFSSRVRQNHRSLAVKRL